MKLRRLDEMAENTGFVLQYDAASGKTFFREGGRLIGSGSSWHLTSDKPLAREVGRTFYFLPAKNEGAETDILEMELLHDADVRLPYSYEVKLTGNKQTIPTDKWHILSAPEGGAIFWEQTGSTNEV